MNPDRTLRIALFRTDRIGEVVLSTAAIDIIRKNFPEAEITFFTSRYSAGVITGHPGIAETVPLEPFRPGRDLLTAVSLARQVRPKGFAMSIVLNPHRALHLACFLAGIPRRCGFDRKWGWTLTDRVPDRRGQAACHEVEYTRDFFRGIGFALTDGDPALRVEAGMADALRQMLTQHGLAPKTPLIVIHPCASNSLKFWSRSKYAELISVLAARRCLAVVIGEEREHGDIQGIIHDSRARAINAAGMFNLSELTGLLSIADLFIGNDSGPMHMAAVLGRRVIAIFSKREQGSTPVRWRPWGDGHAIFHELYGEPPCPVKNFTGYYIAKNDVAVHDVEAMAVTLLDERGRHAAV